jgi:uroporphyrinogen decarboxylase
MVPHALGQDLRSSPAKGRSCRRRWSIDAGSCSGARTLQPIYETVGWLRDSWPRDHLLGFAGSPWTVATYMIAGEAAATTHAARSLAYRDPAALQAIVDASSLHRRLPPARSKPAPKRCSCSIPGLAASPRASSSAGVIAPNAAIVAALHERHPAYR